MNLNDAQLFKRLDDAIDANEAGDISKAEGLARQILQRLRSGSPDGSEAQANADNLLRGLDRGEIVHVLNYLQLFRQFCFAAVEQVTD